MSQRKQSVPFCKYPYLLPLRTPEGARVNNVWSTVSNHLFFIPTITYYLKGLEDVELVLLLSLLEATVYPHLRLEIHKEEKGP